MENENQVEYSKFSQYMAGQFRRTSKKSIALFIGRSVQLLIDSLQPFIVPKKLKMETLRFAVIQKPLTDSSGDEVPGWDMVIVAYEVGSETPITDEDRKAMEERRREREERLKNEEKEIGEAAMAEMERQIYADMPVENRIQ